MRKIGRLTLSWNTLHILITLIHLDYLTCINTFYMSIIELDGLRGLRLSLALALCRVLMRSLNTCQTMPAVSMSLCSHRQRGAETSDVLRDNARGGRRDYLRGRLGLGYVINE